MQRGWGSIVCMIYEGDDKNNIKKNWLLSFLDGYRLGHGTWVFRVK